MNKFITMSLIVAGALLTHTVYADSAKLINPANEHSYKRFDSAKSWTQAKNACSKQSGHLATITSQEENDWIVSKIVQGMTGSVAYIGGTDAQVEGVWKWITDEPFVYSNWNTGEPNNGNGGAPQSDNAIHADGTWDDGWDSDTYKESYICEWDKPLTTYSQVTVLPDINTNGSQELALVGALGTKYMLFVYDSETQAVINESVIKSNVGYTIKSMTVMNDIDNNGASEVAILITKTSDNSSVLQLQDTLTGAIVKTITLQNQ